MLTIYSADSPRTTGLLKYVFEILVIGGLIKGFMARSKIAWYVARVLVILGTIVLGLAMPFLLIRGLSRIWPIPVIVVAMVMQVYVLLMLYSREVRRYCVGEGEGAGEG